MVGLPSLGYGAARLLMAYGRGDLVDWSYAVAFVLGSSLVLLIPKYAHLALRRVRLRSGRGPALKASAVCLGVGALGGPLIALDLSHPLWVFGLASLLVLLVGLAEAVTVGLTKEPIPRSLPNLVIGPQGVSLDTTPNSYGTAYQWRLESGSLKLVLWDKDRDEPLRPQSFPLSPIQARELLAQRSATLSSGSDVCVISSSNLESSDAYGPHFSLDLEADFFHELGRVLAQV